MKDLQILGPDGHPVVRSHNIASAARTWWTSFAAFAGGIALIVTFLINIGTMHGLLFSSPDVHGAIAAATSNTEPARIAGMLQLGSLLSSAPEPELPAMVGILTEGLRSNSAPLREAAADAIGRAYSIPPKPGAARALLLRKLLYGSAKNPDFVPGAVVNLNWELSKDPVRWASQLKATREAIRKNWTDLRNTHLKGASLIGAKLWRSHLEGSYLADADLRYADLGEADLTNADVTGVRWDHANVKDLKPDSLRSEALKNGAISVDKGSWSPPDDNIRTLESPMKR